MTYVHVECVPCVYYRNGNGPLITDPKAGPMCAGLRFTRARHETIARLAWDIAQRHEWPIPNLGGVAHVFLDTKILHHYPVVTEMVVGIRVHDAKNHTSIGISFTTISNAYTGGNIAMANSVSAVIPRLSSNELHWTLIDYFCYLIMLVRNLTVTRE